MSIVIPTYNRAHTLGRAIDSMLAQALDDWEIVLVDDGSSDTTNKLLEHYDDPRIRVFRHSENRGVTAAKNTGLDNIRGVWFSILDSDDELLPNALSTLVGVAEGLGQPVDSVICNCVDSSTGEFSGGGVEQDGWIDEDAVCFTGESWSITRRSVLGDERFNRRLKGFEGILWSRLVEKMRGRRYYIHQGLRVYHTEGADRVSHRTPGDLYESYVALFDEEADHLQRTREQDPAGYHALLFYAGVDFCWHGDRMRTKYVLEQMSSAGAPLERRLLIGFGVLFGPSAFRTMLQALRRARALARGTARTEPA